MVRFIDYMFHKKDRMVIDLLCVVVVAVYVPLSFCATITCVPNQESLVCHEFQEFVLWCTYVVVH